MVAGELVGCIVFNEFGNMASCLNFSAGGLVAVPANTLHSAENPGCTPVRAMQALSGGVSTQCSMYFIIAETSLQSRRLDLCIADLDASPCSKSQLCR